MKIKNIDSVAHTWGGVEIAASGEYTVSSDVEWASFATDSAFFDAIVADEAQVNDGVNDLSSHLAQINYVLKKVSVDSQGHPIYAPTFEFDENRTKEWTGRRYPVTAGVLNIWDEWNASTMYLRGGWYEIFQEPSSYKTIDGDTIEFSIVDKDDVMGLFSLFGLTARTNEVQTFTFSAGPTAGTYTLTHSGNTTSAIAYDASDAEIAAALNALSSLKHVSVSTDALVKTVSFLGEDGGIDQPQLTSDTTNLTGATISHATTTAGAEGDVLELSKYIKTIYINPYGIGRQPFSADAIATLLGGLFRRTYVNSSGATNFTLTTVLEEYQLG